MKKIKRERGFYRQLKNDCKMMGEKVPKPMYAMEFRLEHASDSSKDVRIYARFCYQDEVIKSIRYLSSLPKEDYKEYYSIRDWDQPRTRREKEIHRSRLSFLIHINQLS